MAEIAEQSPSRLSVRPSPRSELFRKEDWWAIWIGLGLVAIAIASALGLSEPAASAEVVAPATLRKRLQRAIERLRVAWRTKHGTP